jgi:predicted esterase
VSTAPLDLYTYVFQPGASPDVPVLLLLHGTGGTERDLLPLGPMIAPGAALLSPLGLVRENGMPRWFRRVADGVFDQEDLRARVLELADWLDVACAHHGLVRERVIACGFSNGANTAAAMLLLHPRALAGAILMAPMVPFEPEAPVDLAGVPVLITSGRSDQMIPSDHPDRLRAILERCGAAVEMAWSDGGHTIAPEHVSATRRWMQGRRAG